MGFKRTTDGRVFFQGTDGSASDIPQRKSSEKETAVRQTTMKNTVQPAAPVVPSARGSQQAPANAPSKTISGGQATQIQILQLLRALNDKLQSSQAERKKMRVELDRYRNKIQELEDRGVGGNGTDQTTRAELEETREKLFILEQRTAQNDKKYNDLISQASQHKKVSVDLSRKQTQLEKQQKSQNYDNIIARLDAHEIRQDDLSEQVSNAMSGQERLMRKLEQTMEERARFMRKIERIEEAVVHTRDALNAKAMVLLSDQQKQGEGDHIPKAISQAAAAAAAGQGSKLKRSLWSRSWNFSTPVMVSVCIAAIIGGWFISDMQKPNLPDLRNIDLSALNLPIQNPMQSPAQEALLEAPSSAQEWIIREDNSAFINEKLSAVIEEIKREDAQNDIGALDINDQAQLEELMADDPVVLAAALNEIEPGMPSPSAPVQEPAPAEEKIAIAAPVSKVAAKPASSTPAKTYDFARDISLPPSIRVIEDDAFKGIPEAQHDLAAVYTAGHGGVRQNYKKAAYWFEEAANGGIANAAYNLGVLYHQGLGVDRSVESAMLWYKKAAQLDHPEAQYNLGIAHIEGIGVMYNPTQAADYFKGAAQQGVIEAAYNLGLIYENALLGIAKPEEALHWYKIASDGGSPEAKIALNSLARALDISIEDINRIAEGMRTLDKDDQNSPQVKVNLKNLTAQVQDFLTRAGLYTGAIDGVGGQMTVEAVRSYQAIHNISITGDIDSELMSHMLGNESSMLLGEQGSRAQ